MKNNYKLLIINNDNLKNYKLENKNIKRDNFCSINKTTIYCVKFICITLLIFIINSKVYKLYFKKNINKHITKQEKSIDNTNLITHKLRHDRFWNYTALKNEMNSYGLYNAFKFPQLSIIIMNNEKIKFKSYIYIFF